MNSISPIIDSKHDFASKLLQASLYDRLVRYVDWQRAVRRAKSEGREVPLMPENWGPISINLDPTTVCNYRCPHCIDYDKLNTPFKFTEGLITDSLAELHLRGLKSVIIIGGGEPTVYPGFSGIVRYIKSRGMQVGVVSNGSGNQKILEIADLLDECDWVRLSLDSGTDETFRIMHLPQGQKGREITLRRICEWVPKIKAVNPRFQFGFSFIVSWKGATRESEKGPVQIFENIDEIVAAAELARDHKFDYLSVKAYLRRSENEAEVLAPDEAEGGFDFVRPHIEAEIEKARRLETEKFKVKISTNLRLLIEGESAWRGLTNQPHMCHKQALQMVVSPLGLFNCPAHRGVEKARISHKSAYKDVPTADKTSQAVAAILDRFDATRECIQVACLYNHMNWQIERWITGEDTMPQSFEDRGDYFF